MKTFFPQFNLKLRTRLFFWIGGLFFLFATISYFIENILVQRHLKESEREMRGEIQKNEEETRKHYEDFLGIVLSDFQAQIDALLFRLEEFSPLKAKFIQSSGFQTWNPSALLLLENKWIGLIQNTYENKFSSLLIPDPFALDACEKKIIDEDLAWIHFYEESLKKVYIGIRISSEELDRFTPSLVEIERRGQPDEYYFYEPKTLLNLEFDAASSYSTNQLLSQEEESKLQAYRQVFLDKIQKAKEYLRTYFEGNGKTEEIFKKEPEPPIFPPAFFQRMDPSLSDIVYNEFIESLIEYIHEDRVVRMMWKLSSLLYLDLFGSSPIDPKAPLGVAMIFDERTTGSGIYSNNVFYDQKIFNDNTYFTENVPEKDIAIPSTIALISDPNQKRLFLGNVLKYSPDSFLTLGIDMSDMLQRLSLAVNQYALLVHEDEVLTVYNPQGINLRKSIFYSINPKELVGKEGFVEVGGQRYYYLRLKPYENSDLHFYILELESKAFAFVNFINEEMSSLIENVTFSMRAIGLVALVVALILIHNIAKKITNPISKLAKLTEPIVEGHYDQVDIPQIPVGHSQEVKKLCSSFSEMVKGLKDKEKVRGVLNKVVSKEIAEEILKGAVHLGGEEKTVTILFADIRNFTKMTENMQPHEVIDLLNNTMTKLSQAVDQSGGVIDKFVGDEVMALFGAPIAEEKAVLKAVISAKLMLETIDEWNLQRKESNLPHIEIGVGIHTGLVVAGNMGAENRLNYTVLGANVNLAARICSIAGPHEILITQETLNQIQEKEQMEVKKLDPVELKGFTEKVAIYRLENISQELKKSIMKNA